MKLDTITIPDFPEDVMTAIRQFDVYVNISARLAEDDDGLEYAEMFVRIFFESNLDDPKDVKIWDEIEDALCACMGYDESKMGLDSDQPYWQAKSGGLKYANEFAIAMATKFPENKIILNGKIISHR